MSDSTAGEKVTRVCAWCGKSMGRLPASSRYRHPVTHGMCGACSHVLSAFRDLPLQQLIDRLDEPVLVVDDATGLVVTANQEAAAAFGKTVEDVAGQKGGAVMECVHTLEPGGCGRTEHCNGCTIRRLVTRAEEEGCGEFRAPAFQYCVTPAGIRKQHFLISTEKLEDLVLLRLEFRPAGEEPQADPQ